MRTAVATCIPLLLLASWFFSCTEPGLDVLILGGTVYDGTDQPPRQMDIGIKADTIAFGDAVRLFEWGRGGGGRPGPEGALGGGWYEEQRQISMPFNNLPLHLRPRPENANHQARPQVQ